jgi:glycosyltransferase involved in cell wall biosynthesis
MIKKKADEQPLVSVLMTAYNRDKYIGEAIESVISSTYKNWELIIVDDCSKDRTVEIARQYERKDERIKVYVNENNLGDYPNRNKAASYAKGKYLKYVDADDMIYPYGLEQLIYYMEQFPGSGYGLCSLVQDKKSIYPLQLSPTQAYHRHYFVQSIFHKAPLSSIIKKDIFEAIGGFSGQRMLGDFKMWHILSQKYPVLLMPHGIVWYREHDEQEMSDHRINPAEPFKYLLLQEQLLNNQDCPLTYEERQVALKNLKTSIIKSILNAFRYYGTKKGKELKSLSRLSWLNIIKIGFSSIRLS